MQPPNNEGLEGRNEESLPSLYSIPKLKENDPEYDPVAVKMLAKQYRKHKKDGESPFTKNKS